MNKWWLTTNKLTTNDILTTNKCHSFLWTPTLEGSEPQKHHRDINFPGPAAQVTAQAGACLVIHHQPMWYIEPVRTSPTSSYGTI